MSDKIRTLSELQGIHATNLVGNISAQDIRDFLVSCYNWVNKASGDDIYYSAGKVGIGITTPHCNLDIVGSLLVGESVEDTPTGGYGAVVQASATTAFFFGQDYDTPGALDVQIGNNCSVIDMCTSRVRIRTASDALANNAAGTVGDIAFGTDTNKYLYIWFATNTPSRVQLNTW